MPAKYPLVDLRPLPFHDPTIDPNRKRPKDLEREATSQKNEDEDISCVQASLGFSV